LVIGRNGVASVATIMVSTGDLGVSVDGALIDEDMIAIDAVPVTGSDALPAWPTLG